MPDGGYSHDPGGLHRITAELREGADLLDQAAAAGAEAPDAGASSMHVARAMQALMTSTVAAAQMLDDHAERVNAANGAYHDIENTNAGAFDKRFHDEFEQKWGDKPMGERNIPLN